MDGFPKASQLRALQRAARVTLIVEKLRRAANEDDVAVESSHVHYDFLDAVVRRANTAGLEVLARPIDATGERFSVRARARDE